MVSVFGGKSYLFDKRIRLSNVHRGIVIRANHHAVRADQINQEAQSFGIESESVVVKAPDVFPEGAWQFELLGDQATLDSPRDIRETSSGMRQHNFEIWKFVERTGDDKFRGGRRAFKRK